MSSADIRRTVSSTHRELNEKKGIVVQNLRNLQEEENAQAGDGEASPGPHQEEQTAKGPPASDALKVFFDRIPLSSIPGLNNEQVLEVGSKDCMGEVIKCLYEASVMGAPVFDEVGNGGGDDSSTAIGTDPYIGLIELSSLVLWVLQELEKMDMEGRKRDLDSLDTDSRSVEEEQMEAEERGFFKSLRQHLSVWDTKVAVIGRSFRWGPFLPVRPEDTLLHALLILSKHSLKAVPVMNSSNKSVVGFITQDAAIQLLLQCGGLEWFDVIADKKLKDFKFQVDESSRDIVQIDTKKTVMDAMTQMWEHRIGGMPIVDAESKKIVGNIRTTDVRLLLDSSDVFERRRSMTLEELMKIDMELTASSPHVKDEEDMSAIISAAALHLKRGWRPIMTDVVTCAPDDTLKDVMSRLAKAQADRGFLVDEEMHMVGFVTLRDIIIQFTPPLTQLAPLIPGFSHA